MVYALSNVHSNDSRSIYKRLKEGVHSGTLQQLLKFQIRRVNLDSTSALSIYFVITQSVNYDGSHQRTSASVDFQWSRLRFSSSRINIRIDKHSRRPKYQD
jgi:hypothetical protein